jgi:hypothetical protein
MNKKYSEQQIIQFFQQLKKLENSFSLEKVHQIINDPNAKARYKVKTFKTLNLIIMTFLISISIVLVLLFSAPDTRLSNETENDLSTIKEKITNAGNSVQPSFITNEPKKAVSSEIMLENGGESIKSQEPVLKLPVEINKKVALPADTVVDGSRFILELTNKELEKLGFQIQHYSVFYRNSCNSINVFYLSTHYNGRMFIREDGQFVKMKDYYKLQTDPFPESITIKQMKTTSTGMGFGSENSLPNDVNYIKSGFSYYPLFNTNQKGEVEKISDQLNFDDLADTLMPIVIKISQLDLERKHDQFFWFITNDDFYANLPERYAWVKEEFEVLKLEKCHRGEKLNVDFKVNDWNKGLLIPDNVVLNGQNYIVQFSKEELEKVGVFGRDGSFSHLTPYTGRSLGGTSEIVNGRIQMKFDTIFNVDYYVKYETNCFGDFLSFQSTIKRMKDFLIDNDILLPVQLENKDGNIYWFTLSEEFWKLVPERYAYLKEHYDKILYNKSIEPNRDFVKYFNNPFKKVGGDVSIIELSKEELEHIGFRFVDKESEISCGFGQNWIQFRLKEPYSRIPEKIKEKINEFQFENVYYISPNKRFVRTDWVDKFDSLYQAANQGYQFVYITDSIGRHMHKILILEEDIQIKGADFKYLIPIMVRQSKIVNPKSEDRVFWFTPTKAFFDRLPDRIKNELKKEFEIVSSDGKSTELSACTYFESCKSTLKVENLKIYPNPAQKEITVDFNLDSSQEGIISIANIIGQQIKVLSPKSKFHKGFNSIKCDLGGIKSGIYLVSIVTDSGFKTERLIISE